MPSARDQPTGLDLAERERFAVERDDVELSPPRSVVALDDLEPTPLQVLGGELFTESPEPGSEVIAHPSDATPVPVTCGSRGVPILRSPGAPRCAELEQRVTHV